MIKQKPLEIKVKKTKDQLKNELFEIVFGGDDGLGKEEEVRIFRDAHGQRKIVIVARKTTILDYEE